MFSQNFRIYQKKDTAIIGPNGNLVSDYVPAEKEGIAYADINLEDIILYKYQLDITSTRA